MDPSSLRRPRAWGGTSWTWRVVVAGTIWRTAVAGILGLGVVLLWSVPLAEIGDTAVTDHVYIWGVDGFSVAVEPVNQPWADLQGVCCLFALGCSVLALFWARGAWLAAASMAAALVSSYFEARSLAMSESDLIPLDDGLQWSLVVILLLLAVPFIKWSVGRLLGAEVDLKPHRSGMNGSQ